MNIEILKFMVTQYALLLIALLSFIWVVNQASGSSDSKLEANVKDFSTTNLRGKVGVTIGGTVFNPSPEGIP